MSGHTEPLTQREAGFDTPIVRQFTVFLDNRVGRLQTLLRLLEESDLPIAGFSIEESAEAALVRLVLRYPDQSAQMLHKHAFAFSQTDVLAVMLPTNTRQPLITVCAALLSTEINIHYAYPLLARRAIVLYLDDPHLGAKALMAKGMQMLSETDIAQQGGG